MKKFIIFILLLSFILLTVLFLKGFEDINETNTDNNDEYSFIDISWVRDSGHDIETIRFKSDGSFTYFCACGNPVNDADLCEKYTYNEEIKEIELDYFETTEDTITKIKVIKVTDTTLELDFNGEIRKFSKEEKTM